MSRKQSALAVVASLLMVTTVAAGPVAAAPWDSVTDDVNQVTYGADGVPSWHVHVEDGELGALESWANGSDSRAVLQTHNASNYALIRAPTSTAGMSRIASLLGNGLAGESYVTAVRPNYEHDLAKPLDPENMSAVDGPSWATRTLASVGERGGEWSRDGIAYNDNENVTTLDETHGPLGVDNVSATGQGATVAVIDTGVNTADDNSVFQDRVTNSSKDFITGETVGDDGVDAVEDPNGHGTFVAAQVAADHSNDEYDGVAPDADIMALRALDSDGSGSTADIADAVRHAADNDADVIVMSLGSPVYDAELEDALQYAVDQNVTGIAVAAGNSRQTTRFLASPADAPVDGVTAVAATNTSSNGTAGSAYFSNTGNDPGVTDASAGASAGADVDVSAPGMKVEAMVPTTSGTTETQVKTGTSMAGPQVGGIAALGVETGESWVDNSGSFNEHVRSTARPIPNAAEVEVGQGMAAADRLLENETGGDQSEAMDDAAELRDTFWTGLGDWKQIRHPLAG